MRHAACALVCALVLQQSLCAVAFDMRVTPYDKIQPDGAKPVSNEAILDLKEITRFPNAGCNGDKTCAVSCDYCLLPEPFQASTWGERVPGDYLMRFDEMHVTGAVGDEPISPFLGVSFANKMLPAKPSSIRVCIVAGCFSLKQFGEKGPTKDSVSELPKGSCRFAAIMVGDTLKEPAPDMIASDVGGVVGKDMDSSSGRLNAVTGDFSVDMNGWNEYCISEVPGKWQEGLDPQSAESLNVFIVSYRSKDAAQDVRLSINRVRVSTFYTIVTPAPTLPTPVPTAAAVVTPAPTPVSTADSGTTMSPTAQPTIDNGGNGEAPSDGGDGNGDGGGDGGGGDGGGGGGATTTKATAGGGSANRAVGSESGPASFVQGESFLPVVAGGGGGLLICCILALVVCCIIMRRRRTKRAMNGGAGRANLSRHDSRKSRGGSRRPSQRQLMTPTAAAGGSTILFGANAVARPNGTQGITAPGPPRPADSPYESTHMRTASPYGTNAFSVTSGTSMLAAPRDAQPQSAYGSSSLSGGYGTMNGNGEAATGGGSSGRFVGGTQQLYMAPPPGGGHYGSTAPTNYQPLAELNGEYMNLDV